MFHNVLCAYDGSDNSKKALSTAIDLCKENPNAKLHVLHTIKFDPMPTNVYGDLGVTVALSDYLAASKQQGEIILNEGVQTVEKAGLKAHGVLYYGDPANTILEFAEENQIDLIVMGSRGLSKMKELFLGSVSHKVTQSAKCSVLVVK